MTAVAAAGARAGRTAPPAPAPARARARSGATRCGARGRVRRPAGLRGGPLGHAGRRPAGPARGGLGRLPDRRRPGARAARPQPLSEAARTRGMRRALRRHARRRARDHRPGRCACCGRATGTSSPRSSTAGLSAIHTVAWPYSGGDDEVRLAVLLGAPLLARPGGGARLLARPAPRGLLRALALVVAAGAVRHRGHRARAGPPAAARDAAPRCWWRPGCGCRAFRRARPPTGAATVLAVGPAVPARSRPGSTASRRGGTTARGTGSAARPTWPSTGTTPTAR